MNFIINNISIWWIRHHLMANLSVIDILLYRVADIYIKLKIYCKQTTQYVN